MIKNLEQIEYRWGMHDEGMNTEYLEVKNWRGAEIPAGVIKAVDREDLLSLGGVFGDRDAGNPVECDHLKLVLADDTIEITVFNRGIALFTSDDERIRRIHRVLCELNKADDG